MGLNIDVLIESDEELLTEVHKKTLNLKTVQKTYMWPVLMRVFIFHHEHIKLELPRAWDPMGFLIHKGDHSLKET